MVHFAKKRRLTKKLNRTSRSHTMRGGAKITGSNGNTYEGDIQDGLPNGTGTFVWRDGRIYEGEFKNGKPHGTGKITWSNDDTYEGEWVDGKYSGYGNYTHTHHNYYYNYRGYFDNDKEHGWGYIYTRGPAGPDGNKTIYNGTIYGKFENGKMIHATGTRIQATGIINEGEFINNQLRIGKRLWPDNEFIYEGEFDENGECHGKGSMIAVYDGWNFEGIYNHGKRHYGVLHDNGDVYEGEFENNRPHGKGTRKYADGKVHKGRFVMNKPDGPNAITSLRRTWEELGITRDDYVRRSSSTRKHSS